MLAALGTAVAREIWRRPRVRAQRWRLEDAHGSSREKGSGLRIRGEDGHRNPIEATKSGDWRGSGIRWALSDWPNFTAASASRSRSICQKSSKSVPPQTLCAAFSSHRVHAAKSRRGAGRFRGVAQVRSARAPCNGDPSPIAPVSPAPLCPLPLPSSAAPPFSVVLPIYLWRGGPFFKPQKNQKNPRSVLFFGQTQHAAEADVGVAVRAVHADAVPGVPIRAVAFDDAGIFRDG